MCRGTAVFLNGSVHAWEVLYSTRSSKVVSLHSTVHQTQTVGIRDMSGLSLEVRLRENQELMSNPILCSSFFISTNNGGMIGC